MTARRAVRGKEHRADADGWVEVQTFLPYPDFEESARALDTRRLGKQRDFYAPKFGNVPDDLPYAWPQVPS
jgi:hypothetical protein